MIVVFICFSFLILEKDAERHTIIPLFCFLLGEGLIVGLSPPAVWLIVGISPPAMPAARANKCTSSGYFAVDCCFLVFVSLIAPLFLLTSFLILLTFFLYMFLLLTNSA